MHRCGCQLRVYPRHITAIGDRVALHPERAIHLVAGREIWVLRVNYPPDGARAHHLTDLDRRHVGPARVHPGAHRRVDRQVCDPDQELTVGWTSGGFIGNLPIGDAGQTDRAAGQAADCVGERHDSFLLTEERTARPPGSSAVEGTKAMQSAPAAPYSFSRAAIRAVEPNADTLSSNSTGRSAASSRRVAPLRARTTRSSKPSALNISPYPGGARYTAS